MHFYCHIHDILKKVENHYNHPALALKKQNNNILLNNTKKDKTILKKIQ